MRIPAAKPLFFWITRYDYPLLTDEEKAALHAVFSDDARIEFRLERDWHAQNGGYRTKLIMSINGVDQSGIALRIQLNTRGPHPCWLVRSEDHHAYVPAVAQTFDPKNPTDPEGCTRARLRAERLARSEFLVTYATYKQDYENYLYEQPHVDEVALAARLLWLREAAERRQELVRQAFTELACPEQAETTHTRESDR